MPVFIPKPPAGGNLCAASPASSSRPRAAVYAAATCALMRQGRASQISNPGSDLMSAALPPPAGPAAAESSAAMRSGGKSAGD